MFTLTDILYVAVNGSGELVSEQRGNTPSKGLDPQIQGGGQPTTPAGKYPCWCSSPFYFILSVHVGEGS